ncbi:MAG TPA: hypothetical protein PKC49_07865 [Phycisphaerae bacterium]|nr:hypothetical protein [Phycisphaerae bacterium]
MRSLYHQVAVALFLSACCGATLAPAQTTPAQKAPAQKAPAQTTPAPQPAAAPDETSAQTGAAAASLTPSQLLGGVQRLGDETIAALVRLAQDAELVQDVARDPALLDVAGAALPAELRAAAAVLARTPEVVVAAAAMPEALAALRELYTELPAGAAARVEELRRGYARADREAAQRWQALLEGDAAAQRAYADWLTRFSNAQRALNPRFPCVQVMSPGYYGALPPDDAFIAYVLSTGRPPEALDRVLREFWREHAPALRDQRVQQRAWGEAPSAPPRFIAGLAAAERRGMFKPTDQPDPAAIGLAPAFLQPKEDQAPEVQRIAAVTEIARLWSEPLRDAAPPVAADAQPSPPPGGSANIPAGPRVATTAVSVAGGGARVPDFAAPQYVLGGVSLSSGAYWGVFPHYTYYGRPYSSYRGAAYWPTSRDCDKRYFVNYGYPYGNRGGFIDGRYVPPCAPVDPGPRGGSAARLPAERFSPTGIGVIRHYPSALKAVGGVRRSSASINRLTTPTYRGVPTNPRAPSRTGRSDATSNAPRPRAMATPAIVRPQPRPAATNWRAAPGRPPGSVELRSGRSTGGAGRNTGAGGVRNVRPAPPQRLAGPPR